MVAKKLPPGLRAATPTSSEAELDLLTTSGAYLVWTTVRNNPQAVAANLGEPRMKVADSHHLVELFELVKALDAEEQATVLDVPWVRGTDAQQDAAFDLAMTMGKEAGGGLKFAPLVAGIMAAVSTVAGVIGQQGAQQAAIRAEAAQAVAEAEAAGKAEAAKAQRKALIRKWWPIAVAVLAILLILILRKA